MTQLLADSIPTVADVDHDDIVVPCRECKTDVPYKSSVLAFFGNNERIVVCDDCCDNAAQTERQEKSNRSLKGRIEEYIPPFYLETDFNQLPKQAQHLWRYGYKTDKFESIPIQNWSYGEKGIYILGASRTGKTRTMCLLLRQLYEKGIEFKLFQAGQFHAALTDAKRSSFYSRWITEQVTIPVLAIDDLFAEKITETIQAGLFEVIEQRMARKLPMLVTTQVKKSDAVKQFTDPRRGEALLNRLRESCDPYVTNESQLQEEIK
jgi:DNA replication protein DnaC